MAFAKPLSCSSFHSPATGCPVGISSLESPGSAATRSLLEKLGMNDGQLQDQLRRWHEYAFNLGSGELFDDYSKASNRLLQRNLPEIFYDCQNKGIFVPELNLPKVPRAVNISQNNRDADLEVYESRKQNLDGPSADFLQVKGGTVEKQHIQGELVEMDLAEALKAEFDNPGVEVVVLQGPIFRTPDSPKMAQEEKDCVLIHKKSKYIMGIESKRTLTPKTFLDAATQLDKLRALVNIYFGDQLKSGEWVFMGFVNYEQIHDNKINLCPDCQQFTIHGAPEFKSKLAQAGTLLQTKRPACNPCHEEYKTVVKDLVFTTLAQPMNTKCHITKAVHEKIIGKKAKKKGKDDVAGQGDVRCVLFWTTDQANLMLSHDSKFQFVAFVSSWSTGKTLCMREMAMRRANQCPGEQIYFCIMSNFGSKKTLLHLELERLFKDLNNVTVIAIETDSYSIDGLQLLQKEMESRPSSSSFFLDEFILPHPRTHSAFTPKLDQLVQRMRTQPGRPLLWLAVAGIAKDCKAEHFELSYLKPLLDPLHVVEGMSYPLRNTMATLKQAELQSGNSQEPLYVASNCESNVRLSIPPGLIAGVEGRTFTVQDKDNQVEVEDNVRRAREAMADRVGQCGILVLCAVDLDNKEQYKWIVTGLQAARPGKNNLIYTSYDDSGQSEATEDMVADWMARMDVGHVDEDLLTDQRLSRGFESREVLVIDLNGCDEWQNLVMRSMAHSVAVV